MPNTFAAIAAHGPAALKAVLAADTVLASGGLTKSDKEIIKLVISEAAGCDYCVAAHSHLGKLVGLAPEVLKQIRDGGPPVMPSAMRWSLRRQACAHQRHRQPQGFRRDQGRRLQRRAARRDQPRLCHHRVHQRLQPHQRYRDRLPGGRLTDGRHVDHLTSGITTMTMLANTHTAQNPLVRALQGSGLLAEDLDYHVVRASMVIMFFFFGYQKWWPYEADRLDPFISNGPLIWWLYPAFGHQGASWFLGVAEWTVRCFDIRGLLEQAARHAGRPRIDRHLHRNSHDHSVYAGRLGRRCRRLPGDDGQRPFLMKDVVLLAVSFYLLRQDLVRLTR